MSIAELHGDELRGLRILVVDDEPETLELVAHALRAAGAEVDEASGAESALDVLARSDPHVVVSDLQMPGLDGFDLMRRLGERARPVTAVALSASSSLDDARRALEAGFAVHVAKPIAVVDLVATIRAAAPPPSLRRE
ncbi:MAG: response regulator [Labilithrix sp.]|nr:response regulator [Labilithrix sp.]MCW5813766.1 response regulator [Labilithrix sp.]